MEDRKDALVAASHFIGQVPETVRTHGNPYTVSTVGTIRVTPNSVNVVARYLYIPVRDPGSK